MIVSIIVLIKRLIHLPEFIFWEVYDLILYIKNKGWTVFEGWGLHLYVGAFGAGKTSTMVKDALATAKAYPQVTILTNFALYNFPKHTTILPLKTVNDILEAPDNTLVLIDEIGTIFNSRDFVGGQKSLPKILFQHICQCRKRHIQIFATTQRWNFLDKQLRDITATVNVTKLHFKHPFSRMATVWTYDAVDYDLAYTNPMYSPQVIGTDVYIQSNKLRRSYDTSELVQTMLTADYVSDAEILQNRGELAGSISEIDGKTNRKVRRNRKMM